MTHDHTKHGILLMLLFCLLAPAIDVFAKIASTDIPVGQITAARFLIQALVFLPFLIRGLRTHHVFRLKDMILIPLRAGAIFGSTLFFILAVKHMPLADALAIVYVEPFLVMFLAWVLLGESVGWHRIAASIICLIGTAFVIQPSFALFGHVALYPLGTALCFAIYMLVTREVSDRFEPLFLQPLTATIACFMVVPPLFFFDGSAHEVWDPVMPHGVFWLWLLGVGVSGAAAHLALSYALKFAPSATLAPLSYLEIITATVVGFLVFGDIPTHWALFGVILIVISGLYLIWRETQLKKRVSMPTTPPPSVV
ncbi:MAG: DMT family transporter [Halocynthiibacter sp.]